MTTMTTMTTDQQRHRAWTLVLRREILVRLTDKAFVFGTLLTVAIIGAFMGFSAWQAQKTNDYTLIATPDSRELAEQVAATATSIDDKVMVQVTTADDAAAAERLLKSKDSSAWLHPGDDGWILTTEDSAEDSLQAVVEVVVRTQVLAERAAELGTTVADLERGSSLTTTFLRGDAQRAEVADAVGFVFAFLFYIAALVFGIQLANSVVEEKQSRIVEIIAASIPVRHLLAGKILGNTVLALLQIVVYAAVGLVGMSFTPYASYVPDISGPVLWFLAFFVAGFVALASLWAVAGSLASRTEDLQSTSTPMTMLVMGVFFAALLLEGRAATIGSFIPPLSAVLMPKRILAGEVPVWEPMVALALIAVFATVTVILGERLYRRSLLQTQGRVTLRQAWSAAE